MSSKQGMFFTIETLDFQVSIPNSDSNFYVNHKIGLKTLKIG